MALPRRRVPSPVLAGVFFVACFLVIFVSGIARISASLCGMSKTFLVLLFSSVGASLAGPYTYRCFERWADRRCEAFLARVAILLSFSIPFSLILIFLLWKLLLLDHLMDFVVLSAVLAVPFLFSATIFIAVLSRFPREAGRLGLQISLGLVAGCMLGGFLFHFLSDVYVTVLNGVFATLAAFAFSWERNLRKQRSAAVAMTLFVTALSYFKTDISFARLDNGVTHSPSGYVLLRSLYDLLPSESIFARMISSSVVVALLIACLFLVLFRQGRRLRSSLACEKRMLLLYFVCVGIGLGIVGLSLFWEYSLFVADPLLASTLVLFILSASMATGTWLVKKLALAGRRNAIHGTLLLTAGALACIITLYAGPFEDLVGLWKNAPALLRIPTVFLLLFPFGMLVGVTVPLAWSFVREEMVPDLPKIAGSLSGMFSLGLLLALCLSLGQGFDVSLMIGQVFLLMAFILVALMPQSPPT